MSKPTNDALFFCRMAVTTETKSMLSSTLNTNEIKDSTGAEVEFTHKSQVDSGRTFSKIGENPSQPYRLSIAHQEIGSGLKKRRRSVVRIDKSSISTVDSVTPITNSCYVVMDAAIGAISTTAELAHILANIMSFIATTGAGTTVLFDGSGNGAKCLINGEL